MKIQNTFLSISYNENYYSNSNSDFNIEEAETQIIKPIIKFNNYPKKRRFSNMHTVNDTFKSYFKNLETPFIMKGHKVTPKLNTEYTGKGSLPNFLKFGGNHEVARDM
jgi:hypothetical protein